MESLAQQTIFSLGYVLDAILCCYNMQAACSYAITCDMHFPMGFSEQKFVMCVHEKKSRQNEL